MKSTTGRFAGAMVAGILAVALVDCGPPGPGPFDGSYPHSAITITTTPTGGSPSSSANNDTITINATTNANYDMMLTIPVTGGTCVFGATRAGSNATVVDGQTCSVSATGYSYVATTGMNSTATINNNALTVTIVGTYAASSVFGSGTGTFQLTATGTRQ